MNDISCVIAAAGKGERSGLSYPKTLYKINNVPIIIRILKVLEQFDKKPSIIVNPNSHQFIKKCILNYHKKAELIIQKSQKGMGDALLQFKKSDKYNVTNNVLLVWGDIPFIRKSTILKLIDSHYKNKNDFTLISKFVKNPYTFINRNKKNKIISITETYKSKIKINKGERDIGLFLFNKKIIFKYLKYDYYNKFNKLTQEHGFLYLIEHLVKMGFKVQSLPIASSREIISLNTISDLNLYRKK